MIARINENSLERKEQLRGHEPRFVLEQIALSGTCTGCGACVALVERDHAFMKETPLGPVPVFDDATVPEAALRVCPAHRLRYLDLYQWHYGRLPEQWIVGEAIAVRTGYAVDPRIRKLSASGGVITSVLTFLLVSRQVDGVIAVRQGVPAPDQARATLLRTVDEIESCAQSVYVPVSVLDSLRELVPGERYAITCLPDQSAALRALQREGHGPALQITHVIGPFTGTALYPAAIRAYLHSKGVAADDAIVSLRWRAGEWPGHLEIETASGKLLRTKKVYYNYLIPFFITQNSLQNMDFANEFSDLSVGDAWSPRMEAEGGGHAVFTTRSEAMERTIADMLTAGILYGKRLDPLEASEMHGHMIDFKKRGGYIRNRFRRSLGLRAPDFGMRPEPLPLSRILVELVVSSLFLLCRTRVSRWLAAQVPETIIGPAFNILRRSWRVLSKPTKRKGLSQLKMRDER